MGTALFAWCSCIIIAHCISHRERSLEDRPYCQEVIRRVDVPVPSVQAIVWHVLKIETVGREVEVPWPRFLLVERVDEVRFTQEVIWYVEVPVPHVLEDGGHTPKVMTAGRDGEMLGPHFQTVELVVEECRAQEVIRHCVQDAVKRMSWIETMDGTVNLPWPHIHGAKGNGQKKSNYVSY